MRLLLRLFSFSAVLFGLFLFGVLAVGIVRMLWESKPVSQARVEVIELTGVILSSSKLLDQLEEIENDPHVKAVVLRINSPGGMVAPSQEMYDAVVRLDSKKPVIASMASVAASGGYYVALGTRKIFANPGTLTASIGVIMEFANTQKLYQWAKIERYTLKAGKFKDVGSPLKEMTKDERALLESMLNNIHAQFIATVRERRKISDMELANSTDGRIMTGEQALNAKLVDSLGGIDAAVKEAKKVASLPDDAPVVYPQPKRGLLRKLVFGDDDLEEQTSLGVHFGKLEGILDSVWQSTLPSGYRVWMLAPIR